MYLLFRYVWMYLHLLTLSAGATEGDCCCCCGCCCCCTVIFFNILSALSMNFCRFDVGIKTSDSGILFRLLLLLLLLLLPFVSDVICWSCCCCCSWSDVCCCFKCWLVSDDVIMPPVPTPLPPPTFAADITELLIFPEM